MSADVVSTGGPIDLPLGVHRCRIGAKGKEMVVDLSFDDPALPEALVLATEEDLKRAPFGVVRMEPSGRVTLYNDAEQRLSGLSERQTLGKNFFSDVAPCTNNFMVAEKYRREELDEVQGYVFTFAMEPREVTLRMIRRGELLYLLVQLV